MEKLSKLLSKLIIGGVVLAVGILCFVVNGRDQTAFEAISIVIGVALIVISSLAFLATVLVKKRVLSVESAGAASLLALGIFLVVDKYLAGTILGYIVEFVPYELTVVGSVFLADACFILIRKHVLKQNVIIAPVLGEVFIGAITLLLGILALTVSGIKDNKFLILGIILVFYSVFVILEAVYAFLVVKNVYTTVKSNFDVDDNVIDANPVDVEEEKEE